jgi:hypothetical protein
MQATDWRLRLDAGNIGAVEGWPERGLPADTIPADVPGVWNTIAPGYAGVAWYEVAFRPDLPRGGSARLVVGGANYLTDAWLNGTHLGRHEGGYDAFAFRCGHALREGENRLTLRIVDPPLEGEIDGLRLRECPTAKESWYGGAGGPWGGVWLERSSEIWIEDVRVHGDLAGERATFRVTLASNLVVPTMVRVQACAGRDARSAPDNSGGGAPSPGASATLIVDRQGAVATLTVPTPAPRAWSPESPSLTFWQVGIEMPGEGWVDVAIGQFGYRTCELRDGVFYLNGEPRYLKGALLQPTYPRSILAPTQPVHPGEPLSLEDARDREKRRRWFADIPPDPREEDVRIAEGIGLNLIRFHLRPPLPGILTQCDRRGMMAYVEPPLAWIEPSGRLLEHGRRELAALVRACGNHPSVVLWGIFNENARATEAVGGDLMAELAALDPTRPIIENSGGAAVGEVGQWAWGGQSRCWSPGWEAPRPLNDVHVYLANPLRQEARTLLATLGDGLTLDVTPGRPSGERIESRLSADAVLVSEYGCGALPDFDAALAAFGDETHLADAGLLRELGDDLARGLARRGLDREIGDVVSLVRQTQALQAEGIFAQTAALRRNPNVSGLILTQLADAGWEQMAGLVGLWRHPRPALAAFSQAIRPRLLHAEVDDPCSAGLVRVRGWLIEEPGLPPLREPAVLTMTVESGSPPHRTFRPAAGLPVRVPLTQVRGKRGRLPGAREGGPLNLMTLPLPAEAGRYQIRARLQTDGWADETVSYVRRLPDRARTTGEGLVLLGRELRASLPDARTDLPADWSGPILAYLPSRPSLADLALAIERARSGAHLCLVGLDPPLAARLEPLLGLPLALHGARGNFMGMHHYLRDHSVFAGLGAPCLADATFAEVLPAWAVEELSGAEVLAGCFTVPDGGRGFLWRASVQTLPFGRGRLTLWQLAVGKRQGGALGRYLLDGLASWLR